MSTKRNTRLRRMVCIGVITCAGGIAVAQAVEQVWVKRSTVNVFADEGAASGKVAAVHKGDKLIVLARDGKWIKVQAGDKQGYVFEDSMSAKEVAADSGLNFGGSDASAMSTASASKGFAESKDALDYGKTKNLSPDGLNQLKAMTDKVNFADWKQFMADGKVGRSRGK